MVDKRLLEKDISTLKGIGNAVIRFGELRVYPNRNAPTSVVKDIDDMVGTAGKIKTESGDLVVLIYDTDDIIPLNDD